MGDGLVAVGRHRAKLAKCKAAARATTIKHRRVTIRRWSGDLQDIQVKALEDGMPCQTLIASVVHKYVSGRLTEREAGTELCVVGTRAARRNASKASA